MSELEQQCEHSEQEFEYDGPLMLTYSCTSSRNVSDLTYVPSLLSHKAGTYGQHQQEKKNCSNLLVERKCHKPPVILMI